MYFIEKWYPHIVSILLAIPVAIYKWNISDIENFTNILGAAVTISSIVIAFLATMLSILITLTNAEVIQRIINGDGEGLLVSYIRTAIVAGLLVALYSMTLYALLNVPETLSMILLMIFVTLISFFILSSYRIIHLVSKILTEVLGEQKKLISKSKKVLNPEINNNNRNTN
jgi:hypothetical protein